MPGPPDRPPRRSPNGAACHRPWGSSARVPVTCGSYGRAAAPAARRGTPRRPLDAPHHLDVGHGLTVHSGGASTLVAPHPIPGDQQERRIGDEVEQIIEPAMRIITGPTVQFGLDLPYPTLRPKQYELRFIGVHQRPPGIPASFLPTCWPPSPCTRLSRARTTTGPPPRPTAIGRQRTCPPPDRLPGGEGDRGRFPRSPRIDR